MDTTSRTENRRILVLCPVLAAIPDRLVSEGGKLMDQKKTGAFLKELRKEKKLTQEQLAEILQVSNRTVSRWENGANLPDLDLLIQIADYYEVELGELLDGERREQVVDKELENTVRKVADYSNEEKKSWHGECVC